MTDNVTDRIFSLVEKGNLQAAQALVDELFAASSVDATGWYCQGLIDWGHNNKSDAIASFNKAIKYKPDYKEACADLGRALEEVGQLALAIKTYEYLFKLEQRVPAPIVQNAITPQQAKQVESWFHEAYALFEKGRLEEAEAAFRRILTIVPHMPETLANLGMVYCAQRRYDEARKTLLHCLHARPGYLEALNILGNTFKDTSQFCKAIAAYRLTIATDPDFMYGWINIGKSYYEIQRYEQSAQAYEQAIRIRPDYVDALLELTQVFSLMCDWPKSKPVRERMQRAIRESNQCAEPFMIAVHAPDLQLVNARRRIAKMFPAAKTYDPDFALPAVKRNDGKLRIGYLSSDYMRHATAHLITELFEQHDRSRFDIYAYSYGPKDDGPERARIEKAVDVFRDIFTLNDIEACNLIKEDGIDILVELKGYTHGHRLSLVAMRPAPLQIHYLGFPGTLGGPFIDYFIADAVTAPPGADSLFAEQLIRLPNSYQINDRSRPLPKAGLSRADCGLPEKGFVFCDFNNPYKITSEVFSVWMRLLQQVQGSVLWIYEPHATATVNLRREAENHGVDPDRIISAPAMPQAEHLQRYQHADLCIDTYPVCSHTTASDALWCGVPLVTMAGEAFITRVAASLLQAVGLPELITTNLQDYEAVALALANDPARIQRMKDHLTQGRMNFTLFDSIATTRAIEAAYLHAAELHRRGQVPVAFNITADLQIA